MYIMISETGKVYKLRHISNDDMFAVKDGYITLLRITGHNVEEMDTEGNWGTVDWHEQ